MIPPQKIQFPFELSLILLDLQLNYNNLKQLNYYQHKIYSYINYLN